MDGFEGDMSYKPRIIHAHANEIAAMALSPTGNLIASASKRVFDIDRKKKIVLYFLIVDRALWCVYS